MKKRIISLCMVVCLLAVAIVGGTMAYFTDEDSKVNTFTHGDVDIEIVEKARVNNQWVENTSGDFGKLQPGVALSLNKVVFTYNRGDDAYIRNYVAIEDPTPKDEETLIHTAYNEATVKYTNPDEIRYGVQQPTLISDVEIDGVTYDIFVYEVCDDAVVEAGAENSVVSMTGLYLDAKFDNADAEAIGGELNVITFSEAIQAAGLTYDQAMTELNGGKDLAGHAADLLANVLSN